MSRLWGDTRYCLNALVNSPMPSFATVAVFPRLNRHVADLIRCPSFDVP
jgi:hypothetical protein